MGWPIEFDDPTREALVLVPERSATVQDLGPFRSGLEMETDLLPESALICAAENGKPVVNRNGLVTFAFEGNANNAVNLQEYHERCSCAAGRLATRYPSTSYGHARPEELHVVARYDLLNYVFLEVLDAPKLEAWSGKKVADFIPPRDLQTPTDDPAVVESLLHLPLRPLPQVSSVLAFLMTDGTILTKDMANDTPMKAWRPGDDGLDAILEKAGVKMLERMQLTGMGGELPRDETSTPSRGT